MAAPIDAEKRNPQKAHLIAQRSKVISKIRIESAHIVIKNQSDDEKYYIKERGGDLKLLILSNSDEKSNASGPIEKIEMSLEKQKQESRRQNREKKGTIDYSVMVDADVFSVARRGRPIDKSIQGVGDRAKQM
mmetsp:Transcript_24582/g.23575  ORF Transcript_24582/g.23575 Transcript_24582/m.23575 type:complete len:133 (+) Transcript_24582:172-570(+)